MRERLTKKIIYFVDVNDEEGRKIVTYDNVTWHLISYICVYVMPQRHFSLFFFPLPIHRCSDSLSN